MAVVTSIGLLAFPIFAAQPGYSQSADPVVRLDTSKGPIFIRVFVNMVPTTANNFLDLVSRGFYSGKIFHRIENWCIQGGDPNGNGTGNFIDPNSGAPRFIPLEINRNLRHNGAGVVAMARMSNPNSASCQFYITKSAMGQLDGKYAIFGRVVGGIQSVYAMRRGDTIMNAQIVPAEAMQQNARPATNSGGGNNNNNSSSTQRRRTPEVPYEPPSEVPDSGF